METVLNRGEFTGLSGMEGYVFQLAKNGRKSILRVYEDNGSYHGPKKGDQNEEVFYLTPSKASKLKISSFVELSAKLVNNVEELDNVVEKAGVKFPLDCKIEAVNDNSIIEMSSEDGGYIGALFRKSRKVFG